MKHIVYHYQVIVSIHFRHFFFRWSKFDKLVARMIFWFICFLRNDMGQLQDSMGQQRTALATYKRWAGGQNN